MKDIFLTLKIIGNSNIRLIQYLNQAITVMKDIFLKLKIIGNSNIRLVQYLNGKSLSFQECIDGSRSVPVII